MAEALRFAKSHEWIRPEAGGLATSGGIWPVLHDSASAKGRAGVAEKEW